MSEDVAKSIVMSRASREGSVPIDNTQADQLGLSLGLIVGSIALIAFYFLPTIVAFIRHHHYRWPIFVINLVAGWTLIGLLGCFVWAVWPRRQQGLVGWEHMTREDLPLTRGPAPLR